MDVVSYASSLGGRLDLIRRAGECDVVFVQKKRMPGWQLRWIKGRGAKIV